MRATLKLRQWNTLPHTLHDAQCAIFEWCTHTHILISQRFDKTTQHMIHICLAQRGSRINHFKLSRQTLRCLPIFCVLLSNERQTVSEFFFYVSKTEKICIYALFLCKTIAVVWLIPSLFHYTWFLRFIWLISALFEIPFDLCSACFPFVSFTLHACDFFRWLTSKIETYKIYSLSLPIRVLFRSSLIRHYRRFGKTCLWDDEEKNVGYHLYKHFSAHAPSHQSTEKVWKWKFM